MTPLTNFDKHAHEQSLKKFREKTAKIKERFKEGDITQKKKAASLAQVEDEQLKYIQESGIICFFGKLFKADK